MLACAEMVLSNCEGFDSEITVYDNYMGQLFSKYEFFGKKPGYRLITYPRMNSFFSFATSAFLPEGYPNSVSKDYLEYQTWDTIQVRLCFFYILILSWQLCVLMHRTTFCTDFRRLLVV